jgi:putative ABC transport system permease protein
MDAGQIEARGSISFSEAARMAVASLWAHKMRSVLTLLGVVIGVTSVIAVVSLVNGLNRYVAEKIFNLGADVFLVNRGPAIITNIDEYEETQKRRKFFIDDYEALRDNCRSCVAVGASVDRQAGQVKYNTDYVTNTQLHGWSPEMPQLYDLELISGRHINQTDVSRALPVCTVGYDIADKLFSGRDPLGREVRVDTAACQVIGVGKKLGSIMGQSRDNWVILPITTYRAMYGGDDSVVLWGKSAGTAGLDSTMDDARTILRGRRHLKFNTPDDFVIETNQSFLSIWGSISGAFFGVTIIIASISLVVGGIVIMNIMLVSVTERTREIGLRKSLGARQRDIRLQFLLESSALSGVGGIFGVTIGILLAKLVTLTTSLPSSVQLWSVALGLLVAVGVGLFFGVYPASKAAQLDPVVALRSE